jgi:murein DD-endopeptidase MepM/ murein hydrolase activator NlpD
MTAWYQFPTTHGFFSAYDPKIFDTPHFANDIGTPFHTNLTTWKSGVVAQEDYAPWGGEVFIKPDDGSEEYYFAHLDDISVKTGQHLSAGQSIGLSGGQTSGGDHPTSPQWSTGPHTHVGYIKSYINTPVGTRPFGDDITGTISMLRAGGISPIDVTPSQQATQSQQAQVQQAANGYKVGIFIIGLIFLAGGFYFVFQNQIHQALKSGKSVVEKAAILA